MPRGHAITGSIDSAEQRRPSRTDRVALVGVAAVAAGLFALPLAGFAENRIVAAQPIGLVSVAPVWAVVLGLLMLTAAAAALLSRGPLARRRPQVLLAGAVALLGGVLFAIGSAVEQLVPAGSASSARVSLGAGAWLALVGIAVLWFQGARGVRAASGRLPARAFARPRSRPRLAVPGAFVVALALAVAAIVWGGLGGLSLAIEYRAQSDTFWTLVANHIYLSLGGTAIAAVLGIPLGILAARRRAVRAVAIPVAGVVQTVPSLALFGLLMVPLAALGLPSIGPLPVLIALTLYAFLPIVRNTWLGVAGVDPAIVDAGRGMGMSRAEILRRVEFPLALPLVLEGVRVALVLTVGIAAVMAIGGAQDLGTLVFLGWGSQAADLTLLGALPMVLLSIVLDRGMRWLERAVVSPGIAVRASLAGEAGRP